MDVLRGILLKMAADAGRSSAESLQMRIGELSDQEANKEYRLEIQGLAAGAVISSKVNNRPDLEMEIAYATADAFRTRFNEIGISQAANIHSAGVPS